jgi:kynureninase
LPADVLLPVAPRKGEFSLLTEDILKVIETQGDEIAIIIFSGVQYYTGQWFEMEKVTKAGRKKVCTKSPCGWQIAHFLPERLK